ncbi:MAG: hypothetical protein ACM3S5_01845 [Rhodospirillales bacterium]
MTHPPESRLALYSGKDLSLASRFRIALHLRGCSRCRRLVREFQGVRQLAGGCAQELPPEVDWDVLAAEMKANIRLGLAAGRCVRATIVEPEPPKARWRAPAIVLPVLLLIIAGWILQSLNPPLRPAAPEFVVEVSSAGIGVQRDGRGFTLLQPHTENVVYSVVGEAAGARYVDEETGQVTISHVYAQ